MGHPRVDGLASGGVDARGVPRRAGRIALAAGFAAEPPDQLLPARHAPRPTPGVIVDGKVVNCNLSDINFNIRILLGPSYHDDWEDEVPQ